MKTGKRIALISGLTVAILMIAGSVFLWRISHRGVPSYDGIVELKGMKDEVTVYRDKYAIPHIYAKNENDLYRAVGYIMAQDRLWQMDLFRRITQGRLSEIFGKDLLEADMLFRSLRISGNSKAVILEMTQAEREGLEAFADGVNQYIQKNRESLPPEFSILKYQPEPWEIIHSVNLIGYMAWDLSSGWKEELMLQKVREKVGAAMYREIASDASGDTAVYPKSASGSFPGFDAAVRRISRAGETLIGAGLQIFNASNNWAVSGKKTATGMPLFSNDMHLAYSVPGIWMQMHQVVEGSIDVTGAALPGQPLIIVGHNKNIAWGMTNVSVDNVDFYQEKVNPDDTSQYQFKGKWVPFEVRREKILIKGGEVIEKDIRFTVHGPVVTDIKDTGDMVVSMKWIGNMKSNEIRAIYLLDRAKDWVDFKNAARCFVAVSQNIAYADKKGNIGIFCAGGIPVRAKGNGMDLMPGWSGDHEWTGIVPFEQLPNEYNPPRGFVSSANNLTAANFRYYINGWGFAPPDRIDRINEILASKSDFTVKDFETMTTDVTSPLSRKVKETLVRELKGSKELTERENSILAMVEKWDAALTAESAAGALSEAFYLAMMNNTFSDELGDKLYREFQLPRNIPLNALKKIWGTNSKWFDDIATKDKVETFRDIVLRSFRDAVAMLDNKLGSPAEGWQWGKLHTLTLQHPLGKVKALDFLFGLNRGPYRLGGSFHTIPQYAYKFGEPFAAVHGPSQRHVYDLSDWDKSKSVIPTGDCGVPASSHYCDQSGLFMAGKFHDDIVSKDLVKKSAVYTMTMRSRK